MEHTLLTSQSGPDAFLQMRGQRLREAKTLSSSHNQEPPEQPGRGPAGKRALPGVWSVTTRKNSLAPPPARSRQRTPTLTVKSAWQRTNPALLSRQRDPES